MLFSTVECPNCGRKVEKSELILVETTIKTRIKCCPKCVDFVDVKRRLTMQGKSLRGRDDKEDRKPVVVEKESIEGSGNPFFQPKELDLREIKISKPMYESVDRKPSIDGLFVEEKEESSISKKSSKPDKKPVVDEIVEKVKPKKFDEEIVAKDDVVSEPIVEREEKIGETKKEGAVEEKSVSKPVVEKEDDFDIKNERLDRDDYFSDAVSEKEEKTQVELEEDSAEKNFSKEELETVEEPAIDKSIKEIIKAKEPEIKEIIIEKTPDEEPIKKEENEEKIFKSEFEKDKAKKLEKTEVKGDIEPEKEEAEVESFELNAFDLKVIKKLKETGESRVDKLAEQLDVDKNDVFESLNKLKKFGLCHEKGSETKAEEPEPVKEESAMIDEPEGDDFEKVESESMIEEDEELVEPEPDIKEEDVEEEIVEPEPAIKEEIKPKPEIKEEEKVEKAVEAEVKEPSPPKSEEPEVFDNISQQFCTKCGAEIPPSQRFCGNCGTGRDGKKPQVFESVDDPATRKRLRTQWQTEWSVASKEMEDLLAQTLDKQAARKKKPRKKPMIKLKKGKK